MEGYRKLRYGWGRFSLELLQKINNPKWFAISVFLAAIIGGFVSYSITFVSPNSIEKQFKLSSSHIGVFALTYNKFGQNGLHL